MTLNYLAVQVPRHVMSTFLRSTLRRGIAYGSLAAGASLAIFKYSSGNSSSLQSDVRPRRESTTFTIKPMAIPKDLPPWQATFAVPMHCQSCVDQIESTLRPMEGKLHQFSL
jgi:hypothetical protein